jgi:polar amino acid transport system substrate-binding protein
MRYIKILLVACTAVPLIAAQSPSATLAPTGTLRAVFLGTNPVHGRVDPKTGEATGVVPDLVKELARRLGVRNAVIAKPDAAAVIDALKNHTADIGFLAYDESRAREVDFGAAFLVMFNSYVVRANSQIQKSSDVDRAGIKVAAVKGQTQELFVSSHLKNAQVRIFQTMPPQTELEALLTAVTWTHSRSTANVHSTHRRHRVPDCALFRIASWKYFNRLLSKRVPGPNLK